jgi:hypothetical protein
MLVDGQVVGAGRFLRMLPAELRGAPVLHGLRTTIHERVKQAARRFDERTESLVVEPRPHAGASPTEAHERLELQGGGHCAKAHLAALRSGGYEADEARALIVTWLERGRLVLRTAGSGVDDRVRAAPSMGVARAAGRRSASPAHVAGPGIAPMRPQVSAAPKIMPRWWKPRRDVEPGPGGR